jgi:single-stranded DNA-binding protein
MANNPIRKVIGNVGQNPTQEYTPSGKPVVNFTIADPVTYGREAPEPRWHKVAIWDTHIGEQVLKQVKKGDLLAVAGPVEEREVNGKTYRNMNAWRIGKVSLFMPARTFTGAPSADVEQAPAQINSRIDDDDDLDWD